MATIHLAVFAAYVVAVVLAVSASSLQPAAFGAGDEMGWTVPAASGDGAKTLSRWATRHRFHVGDVLDFKHWNGSVLLVRHGDYERCTATATTPASGDGGARFTLDRRGVLYFISGVPARCEAGQRMAVRVVARSSLIGAPTPAPADDTLSTGGRLTLRSKLLVSAAAGCAAAFLFCVGLLLVLVYCC